MGTGEEVYFGFDLLGYLYSLVDEIEAWRSRVQIDGVLLVADCEEGRRSSFVKPFIADVSTVAPRVSARLDRECS